jgi:hypothetical protein
MLGVDRKPKGDRGGWTPAAWRVVVSTNAHARQIPRSLNKEKSI